MKAVELEKNYDPKSFEDKLYENWEKTYLLDDVKTSLLSDNVSCFIILQNWLEGFVQKMAIFKDTTNHCEYDTYQA